MGTCYFCSEESRPFFHYYCEKCSKIKRLINIYSLENVIKILNDNLVVDLKNDDYTHKKVSLKKESNKN